MKTYNRIDPILFVSLCTMIFCLPLCLVAQEDALRQTSSTTKASISSTLTVTSSAFKDREKIPRKYGGDEGNIEIPIAWKQGPSGTKSYCVIMDDPDVASAEEACVHWNVFNIPTTITGLSGKKNTPVKSIGDIVIEYIGPCPPEGTHTYFITVYAMKINNVEKIEMNRHAFEKKYAMSILDTGSIRGTFSKKP